MKSTVRLAAVALGCAAALLVLAFETPAVATPQARIIASLRSLEPNPVSPVRKVNRQPRVEIEAPPPEPGFRTIDGSGNNLDHPMMGAAFTPVTRIMPPAYGDGVSQMAGENKPNPRAISNIVVDQPELIPNPLGATDYLWQWGQFIDHDFALSLGTDPPELAHIPVPAGDPVFDPEGTGTAVMTFNRSIYDTASGTGTDNPRQQVNELTAWIDGSQVYGSDLVRAQAIRTNDGTGRLKTSPGNLLPFNTMGLPNAGGPSEEFFLAGEIRANEQLALTAMHTLFVREHNFQADRIRAANPNLTGEETYEHARRIVGAEIQVITYEEFLPALLGPDPLEPYAGYDPTIDAGIMSVFSTACYRVGHTLLSSQLLRLDAEGNEIPEGHLELSEAFFTPQRILEEGGIEPLLRGLAAQPAQRVDSFIVDDVRNFLFGPPGSFGPPGAGGFDLAALNIQRGRDHGLPGYNDVREAFGLERHAGFDDVSSDPRIQQRLDIAYRSVDNIDLWIGALAEDPVNGGHVGELLFEVITTQFENLRDGDRFWYERTLEGDELAEVRATRLSDIIRRNTTIGDELQDDVFHLAVSPVDPDPDPDQPQAPGAGGNPGSSGGGGALGWLGALGLVVALVRRRTRRITPEAPPA